MYGPGDHSTLGRIVPTVTQNSGYNQIPSGGIIVTPGILPGSVKQTEIPIKGIEGQTKKIKSK